MSENYLRDDRGNGKGSISLKAFSAFCHALVGTSIRQLKLAHCGIDAAALGFLPEPPVDPSGVKSTKNLSTTTGARYPLLNSPIVQLRSLNLCGNPLTNSEPFFSTALENYAPRDLRYPSSNVKTELKLDRDLVALQRVCHAISKSRLLTRLELSDCGLGEKALEALTNELAWPDSSIRVLNLNDNPGLVGAHKHVQQADANVHGWAKFCTVLTSSRLGELQLRQVGMGPRALSKLANKLKCEGANPTQLSRSLTALDISDNCLFGFEPVKSEIAVFQLQQAPDQDPSGWKDLCHAIPLAMINTLLVQNVGCGKQGADILASAISVASKRAEDTGQPLRLQCIDLKRNEALPAGHLEPWNDPDKYLVVRH